MHLPELMTIKTVFNNFKNLEATELQLQNREIAIKMGKLKLQLKKNHQSI